MEEKLDYRQDTKTVFELLNIYENKYLNLEPGFQRQSVWTERDRAKLIDSIVRNYPLPSIFLYRRYDNGQVYYDVIDGKQRLESIFKFMNKMRGRYWAKVHLPGAKDPEWFNWNKLCKQKKTAPDY